MHGKKKDVWMKRMKEFWRCTQLLVFEPCEKEHSSTEQDPGLWSDSLKNLIFLHFSCGERSRCFGDAYCCQAEAFLPSFIHPQHTSIDTTAKLPDMLMHSLAEQMPLPL
jgi:hypothetical protein